MNIDKFDINYDTRPYLPDIFIKNPILNSSDSINHNNSVGINSVIFVFNIQEPIDSIYNDPLYLLYGIKKDSSLNYLYPPLQFFYSGLTNNQLNPNIILSSTPTLTPNDILINLLSDIGYNILDIEQTQFYYSELILTETISRKTITVQYFYFNLIIDPVNVS